MAYLWAGAVETILMIVKLPYLPSLGINVEDGGNRHDRATARTYNVGMTASWELGIFGKLTTVKHGTVVAL